MALAANAQGVASMNAPLVSIIMPAYNVERWIRQALDSVLMQTFCDWECIVINDGSSDTTPLIVSSVADARIRLISQGNGGVAVARNKGLEVAQGQYIAFLDADDVWHPQALEHMCSALDANPCYDLCWADFERFDDESNARLPLPGTRLWHTGNVWEDMLVDCFMQFGALCVRAEAVKNIYFNTSLKICEDRDWLLRVLRSRAAIHVPHVVHFYRQRSGSAIRDYGKFLDDEESMIRAHLDSGDVSPRLVRRVSSALQFHRAVLLSRIPGRMGEALRAYGRALILDPLYCDNYLKPLRKLFFIARRLLCGKSFSPVSGVANG